VDFRGYFAKKSSYSGIFLVACKMEASRRRVVGNLLPSTCTLVRLGGLSRLFRKKSASSGAVRGILQAHSKTTKVVLA